MPSDLTIFGAKYLVYIEALLALPVLAYLLFRRPRLTIVQWAVGAIVMLVVGYVAAKIGGALYNDTRPFAADHFRPLISHARDNGFPSDHALLAAAVVAAVFLVRPLWSLLFVPIAALVEWARVGSGVHHPIDVIGSDLFILLGLLVALVAAPFIAPRVVRFIPPGILDLVSAPGRSVPEPTTAPRPGS